MYGYMLWQCFRQLLQKQEKEINIIFFLQHCSVFKYSEKQAWLYKTIYEKYCTKPQSIAKIVLKTECQKSSLFVPKKKKFNRYEEKVMILWFYI